MFRYMLHQDRIGILTVRDEHFGLGPGLERLLHVADDPDDLHHRKIRRGSVPSWMRCPSGSTSGKNCRAIDSLMTTTRGARSLSARPACVRV